MAKYYTLVTNVGRAKMANAQVMGEKVSFSQIALGSSETKPRENQMALGKEEWRGPISNVSLDKDNPNWIIVEAVVPSHVGGFEIAEVGVYDEEGHLIVVGNHPKTYKPKMDEGTTKDVAIRIIIEVSNSEIVELKVDPSVVIATRSYVESAIELAMASIDFSTVEKQIDQHVSDADIHVTAKDKSNWNAKETPSAAQAKATKALNDAKAYTDTRLQQIKSDSTTSSSSDTLATSRAVKTVMDRANEAFTSADNGKKAIRQAIIGVDDGVNVPTNPSFDELAKAIGGISTGARFAYGVEQSKNGAFENNYYKSDRTTVEVSGLDFKPTIVMIFDGRRIVTFNEYGLPNTASGNPSTPVILRPTRNDVDIISVNENTMTPPMYVRHGGFHLMLPFDYYTVNERPPKVKWLAFGFDIEEWGWKR